MNRPPPPAAVASTSSPEDARVGVEGATLQGPPAELRMVLHILRAATGRTETYDVIGHTLGAPDGSNT